MPATLCPETLQEGVDMPRAEATRLYRSAFAVRDVKLRDIRDALRSLEVGTRDNASLGAVFAMFRQVFPTRESWGEKSANMLRSALGRLRLQKSGRKSELAHRLHNVFASIEAEAKSQPATTKHIDECLASDKKGRRGILDPAIHDGRRVAGPADEVGANYHIIYDDELEDDEFADDAKDFQAECDAIAAAGLRANSSDYFFRHRSIPGNLRPPRYEEVAASLQIWAKRPALFDDDTSFFDPTQRAVYDRVCEWASQAAQNYAVGINPPPSTPHASRDGWYGKDAGAQGHYKASARDFRLR